MLTVILRVQVRDFATKFEPLAVRVARFPYPTEAAEDAGMELECVVGV